MKTDEQLITLNQANAAQMSLRYQLQLVLQESTQLLLAFLRFLFVIDLPIARHNRTLVRGLFLTYLIPTFFILGPQAIVLMMLYQFGFNMLLKAALHK